MLEASHVSPDVPSFWFFSSLHSGNLPMGLWLVATMTPQVKSVLNFRSHQFFQIFFLIWISDILVFCSLLCPLFLDGDTGIIKLRLNTCAGIAWYSRCIKLSCFGDTSWTKPPGIWQLGERGIHAYHLSCQPPPVMAFPSSGIWLRILSH